MELFILWIFAGFIPALIARSKGRSFGAWWIYGCLLFPIALVHAIITDDPKRNRLCPFCKNKIMNEAIVCQHCHRDLPAPESELIENRLAVSMDAAPPPGPAGTGFRSEVSAMLAILGLITAIAAGAKYLTQEGSPPVASALERCEPLRDREESYSNCRAAAISGALRSR